MGNSWRTSADSDRLAWPILLLLLLVLVPSLGVVWLMREAVLNERLASSQRLREAYQAQLQAASQSVEKQWADRLKEVEERISTSTPPEAFAAIAQLGFCDGVLILSPNSDVLYPEAGEARQPSPVKESLAWKAAESLEFKSDNSIAAAAAFGVLADSAASPVEKAYARQAQVRCLLKAGEQAEAVRVLELERHGGDIRDEQGRSFAAAAELRLLEILDSSSQQWRLVAKQLAQRLNDYRDPTLKSSQRRFLMAALQRFADLKISFPTQDAEELAANSLASFKPESVVTQLQRGPLTNVWSQATPSGRCIVLFRTETLRQRLLELAKEVPLSSEVSFVVQLPRETGSLLVAEPLGRQLGDLTLGLAAIGDDPFQVSSEQRKAVFIWIAVLVVAVTCVLAWMLASLLRRRLHLARLKNDLVATVSHELKTPLASIRLLVDTLLDAENNPQVNEREYLQLISRENTRLTRLIDNFLTFSRLERGVQRFDFQVLDVQQVVEQAVQVFREHCDGAATCLEVRNEESAMAWGDFDALVTAVLNLLENAWKYSSEEKKIVLTTSVSDKQMIISVQDNGVGLSPRAAGRVFDKFYQVDQRVARSQAGCGLGLSIVRAIVHSHGGEAQVESEPGRGSTFQLLLPLYRQTPGEVATHAAREALQ